jgi:hypothetical protein
MSNSLENLRGGTTIAWHSTRMTIGTYSDSQNRLSRRIRGTRLRRNS